MATNQTKVIPYILVVPTPVLNPPAPPSSSFSHYGSDQINDWTERDQNQNRRRGGSSVWGGCNCLASVLGALLLMGLLAAAIAIPIVVALAFSTTTSTPLTTDTMTTELSTTTVTTATTTTDIPCSPTCQSQQSCVRGVCVGIGFLSCVMTWSRAGDGDIVLTTPRNRTIFYNNTGPSSLTNNGQLDVDDKVGTGPENIFWPNNSSFIPPNGTYYVCFEPFDIQPTISGANPIFVSVIVVRSSAPTLTFQRNFTTVLRNGYACHAGANTLVGSFTYP